LGARALQRAVPPPLCARMSCGRERELHLH
jgi:hypothetical protein